MYWVLGSVTGTRPGVAVGPFILPLNQDAYLNVTLGWPNVPPLAGTVGILDGSGRGTAQVVLPGSGSGLPTPLPVHHAYVVLDLLPGTGGPSMVSHAALVTVF